MSLVQSYLNIGYRLGALAPSALNETGLCSLRFQEYDPTAKGMATKGPGQLRMFFVEFIEGDPLSAATDTDRREAWHVARLHVEYPRVLPWADMHKLILADLDDIVTTLRGSNDTNLLGYDAGHDATDIGLYARVYQGYDINKSRPDVWRLTTGWRCKVRESEI